MLHSIVQKASTHQPPVSLGPESGMSHEVSNPEPRCPLATLKHGRTAWIRARFIPSTGHESKIFSLDSDVKILDFHRDPERHDAACFQTDSSKVKRRNGRERGPIGR
jgi:hypothetical protein